MNLDITTIIPYNDKESAIRLMNELIHNQKVVLGIVVGNDAWCNSLIQNVDIVALNRKESRRGVWIQNPELVMEILNNLFVNSKNNFHLPVQQPFFFTVSLFRKVCDLIPGEPNLDISRIDDAFLSAEIGE